MMKILGWVLAVMLIILSSAWYIAWNRHRSARQPRVLVTPAAHKRVPMTTHYVIPVLLYHRVDTLSGHDAKDPITRDLTVPPAQFAAQLQYLVQNGYQFLTLDEIATAVRTHVPLPERAVAISMDDGYLDNYTQAFPLMRKYHAVATIFLITDRIGTPGHLSWTQVRTMYDGGCRFGSHTVSHIDLTRAPTAMLDTELWQSREAIEEHLGVPITLLAYPAGEYNTRVEAAALKAGYVAAWRKDGGPVIPGDNSYLLPRITMHGKMTFPEFRWLVSEAQKRYRYSLFFEQPLFVLPVTIDLYDSALLPREPRFPAGNELLLFR